MTIQRDDDVLPSGFLSANAVSAESGDQPEVGKWFCWYCRALFEDGGQWMVMLDNKLYLVSVMWFLRRSRVDRGTRGGKVVVGTDLSKRKVNIHVRKILTTLSCASKRNMISPRIGTATFTVAYASNGITVQAPSTFLCWATSSNSCKNTSMPPHQSLSIVPTLPNLNSLAAKPNVPSLPTRLPSSAMQTSNTSNASSGASSTTPVLLTSPCSWHSAQ